jgi:hypothetical protein
MVVRPVVRRRINTVFASRDTGIAIARPSTRTVANLASTGWNEFCWCIQRYIFADNVASGTTQQRDISIVNPFGQGGRVC